MKAWQTYLTILLALGVVYLAIQSRTKARVVVVDEKKEWAHAIENTGTSVDSGSEELMRLNYPMTYNEAAGAATVGDLHYAPVAWHADYGFPNYDGYKYPNGT